MPIPTGVSTCTVVFGKDSDFLGDNAAVTVRIVPSHTVVWEATGERLAAFESSVDAEEGAVGSFQIPHVDQAGFLDVAGNSITGWHYTAYGTVKRGRASVAYRKVFSPLVGQTTIDLDLIPENGQVAAPVLGTVPAVLSVNGQTGAVSVSFTEDPSNPGLYVFPA